MGTFWIDPGSHFGRTLLTDRLYEPTTVSILKDYLNDGGTFVDIGANEGYFSIIASKLVGPSGRVIAIEPQARLQPVLIKNLALNDCHNVSIIQAVISNAEGELRLHLAPRTNTGSTSLFRSTRYPLARQPARATRLESIFTELRLEGCDLMKIDVEGAEVDVLTGSPSLLSSGVIRALVVEVHAKVLARRGQSATGLAETLETSGYSTMGPSDPWVFVRSEA